MKLKNQKILMFVEDHYEDLELHYPKYRMMEEGAKVVIAAPDKNKTYHGKYGIPCSDHISLDEVNVEEFTALIIPGGYAPDHLRSNKRVIEIVKQFDQAKKLIAFICHAGWIPISAGILKGVRCTSYFSIKDDMINAGAKWEDSPVVKDGHFISSRFPGDFPHFCPAIIEYLSQESYSTVK